MVRAHVKTAGELLALVLAFEQRAASGFRLMAARMREEGRDDLVRLFEGLAQEEDHHADKLRQMPEVVDLDAEAIAQDLAPDLEAISLAPDAETLRQLSVYDCLAQAVRNEVKTFDFFSYVAATAEDGGLQRLAETLAKEELGHANALRRVRREAFHQLRRLPGPWPKATTIETLDDLRAAAIRGERAIAARVRGLYGWLPELEEITQSVTELLSSPEQNRVGPAKATSDRPDGSGSRTAGEDRSPPDRDQLRAALDDAKEAFEFYDAAVSTASQEDVMLTAQALSTCALKRIQLLRGFKT